MYPDSVSAQVPDIADRVSLQRRNTRQLNKTQRKAKQNSKRHRKSYLNIQEDDSYLTEPKRLEIPLKCENCDETFLNNIDFGLHSKEHQQQRYYKCHLCDRKPEKNRTKFELHIWSHDDLKKFKCPDCNLGFTTRDSAVRHRSAVHQFDVSKKTDRELYLVPPKELDEPIECKECDEIFTNNLDFGFHSIRHSKSKNYECHLCDYKEKTNKIAFERHLRKHEGSKKFKCPLCHRQLSTYHSVRKHQTFCNNQKSSRINPKELRGISKYRNVKDPEAYVIHPPELENPLTCPVCQCIFTNNVDFGLHSREHNVENKMFKCHICDFENTDKTIFELHIRAHDGINKYRCLLCPEQFPTLIKTFEHQYTHSGERPFECDICGKRFIRHFRLYSHKRYQHCEVLTGKKPKTYTCKICNIGFYNGTSFNRHNFSQHKETFTGNPVLCDVCGKHFFDKSSLREHKHIHSNVKLFSCIMCNKNFSTEKNLKNHLLVHTGIKRYTCTYCGKQFAHNSAFNYHLKLHTGEKPYSCPICGKNYISKGNLKMHMNSCQNTDTEVKVQLQQY